MKSTSKVSLLILSLALSTSSLLSQTQDFPTPNDQGINNAIIAPLSNLYLTPKDNGKSFTVMVSSTSFSYYDHLVEVSFGPSLVSEPSYISTSAHILTLNDSNYDTGGNYDFSFAPTKEGTTTLSFSYDNGRGPQQVSFTITVVSTTPSNQ